MGSLWLCAWGVLRSTGGNFLTVRKFTVVVESSIVNFIVLWHVFEWCRKISKAGLPWVQMMNTSSMYRFHTIFSVWIGPLSVSADRLAMLKHYQVGSRLLYLGQKWVFLGQEKNRWYFSMSTLLLSEAQKCLGPQNIHKSKKANSSWSATRPYIGFQQGWDGELTQTQGGLGGS